MLISEADDPVTVGSGCSLSGGRWFSYYDRVSWTDPGRVDIDHMVPLAEAWDSGAGSWTTAVRQSYANDLGDSRSLVGVTDSVNQTKGDQDPNEWLPTYDKCRYLREWVAVKHRWRLTVDSAEKSALQSLACRLLERHDHGHPGPLSRLLGPRVVHSPPPCGRPSTGRRRRAADGRCRLPSVSVVPDLPARLIDEETT